MSLISAKVTNGFAVRVKDNGVASTIADDRAVASIQYEPLPLVLGDKLFYGLAHFRRPAPTLLALHCFLLCPKPDGIDF